MGQDAQPWLGSVALATRRMGVPKGNDRHPGLTYFVTEKKNETELRTGTARTERCPKPRSSIQKTMYSLKKTQLMVKVDSRCTVAGDNYPCPEPRGILVLAWDFVRTLVSHTQIVPQQHLVPHCIASEPHEQVYWLPFDIATTVYKSMQSTVRSLRFEYY